MLLARSRHASMRSLERYARPGPEASPTTPRPPTPPRAAAPDTDPPSTQPGVGARDIRWLLGLCYGDPRLGGLECSGGLSIRHRGTNVCRSCGPERGTWSGAAQPLRPAPDLPEAPLACTQADEPHSVSMTQL